MKTNKQRLQISRKEKTNQGEMFSLVKQPFWWFLPYPLLHTLHWLISWPACSFLLNPLPSAASFNKGQTLCKLLWFVSCSHRSLCFQMRQKLPLQSTVTSFHVSRRFGVDQFTGPQRLSLSASIIFVKCFGKNRAVYAAGSFIKRRRKLNHCGDREKLLCSTQLWEGKWKNYLDMKGPWSVPFLNL